MGAVLAQEIDGQEQPVAYASKQFTAAESRYSAIERELLALVWAVDQFRPYVFGRRFVIKTDHKPLLWVHKLQETSARITKWKEKLAAYDFEIRHVKGTENVVADCLSRPLEVATGELREELSNETIEETARGLSERQIEGRLPRLDEPVNKHRYQIILEKGNDRRLRGELKRYGPNRIATIRKGTETQLDDWIKVVNEMTKEMKGYAVYSEDTLWLQEFEQVWKEGRLNAGAQFVVYTKRLTTVEDVREQKEIVQNYHLGKTNHRGVSETLARLERKYHWIGMKRSIEEVVKSCRVCGVAKYDRAPIETEQMLTPTPEGPGEVVEVDVFHFDRKKVVTTLDVFSKLATARIVAHKSAEAIRQALIWYMGQHGCPKEIRMDRGREFMNGPVRDLLSEMGVTAHYTTAGHARSHGAIERLHSTLTEHLHLFRVGKELEGEEALSRAVLAYNESIHAATGSSPIEVSTGKVDSHEIRKRLEQKKQSRVDRFNQKLTDKRAQQLRPGMKVYRRNPCKRTKKDLRFLGPYTVVELLDRYRVKLVKDKERSRPVVVHQRDVKSTACRQLSEGIDIVTEEDSEDDSID